MAQCSAHSSRTGEPCKAPAIKGGNVCVAHGGAAPQVRDKARQRLLEAADPLMAELIRLALKADSEAVRASAIKDALDRAGYGAKQLISQEVTVREVDDFERAVEELESELARRSEGGSPVATDPPAAPDRT